MHGAKQRPPGLVHPFEETQAAVSPQKNPVPRAQQAAQDSIAALTKLLPMIRDNMKKRNILDDIFMLT